jgi:peptidoglycan/LPS O-acetylase OafA/YrhL
MSISLWSTANQRAAQCEMDCEVRWIRLPRKFDISYGVYIYGFPIQQIVINKITHHFWRGMAISFVFAMAAGYLSHRFIEKPFLRKRPNAQSSSDTSAVGLPQPDSRAN